MMPSAPDVAAAAPATAPAATPVADLAPDTSSAALDTAAEDDGEDAALLPIAPTPPGACEPVPAEAVSSSARRSRDLAEGIACLVAVTVIWVGAGELTQYLYIELGSVRPVLMTYINVAEFSVLLPVAALRERRSGVASDWRAASRAAALVSPIWFLAQGSFNASLTLTSVASATALSATSAGFSLALALVCGEGALSRLLLAGVALVLCGAGLVGAADGERARVGSYAYAGAGDALAVFSALLYALYSRAIQRSLAVEAIDSLVFFGFVGVWCALLLLPVVAALHFTGVEDLRETLASPQLGTLVLVMIAKGIFDNVLSDLLWARAIMLTSPVLANVGLALTIPLALLADAVFRHTVPIAMGAAGAATIFVGFILATLGERG